MGKAVTGSIEVISSGMSSIFHQLTSLIQAETDIQVSAIEKRYKTEISNAEGNNYQVKKLEKKKEEEIAKVKNDANKKMYTMQVMQAIAQTATAAINAYSSAAAVPVVGWVLAPIAAATAVAAGMLQIAAIKKQQEASQAQGYAEGGFTGEGDKYEVAGVVHKGEWVASQKLLKSKEERNVIEALDYAQRTDNIEMLNSNSVSSRNESSAESLISLSRRQSQESSEATETVDFRERTADVESLKMTGIDSLNEHDVSSLTENRADSIYSRLLLQSPVASPMIEALDYAQRTNTIGSLRPEDVSRTIVAPGVYAQSGQQPTPTVIVQQATPSAQTEIAAGNAFAREYADIMRQLKERLNEPFVTVNTVTGDTGIKQAQEEYEQLMRNKTPKSRRS